MKTDAEESNLKGGDESCPSTAQSAEASIKSERLVAGCNAPANVQSVESGAEMPMNHVIDRTKPVETQLLQAEAWLKQLHASYVSIQQTCANKDARLAEQTAEVERLKEENERLKTEFHSGHTPIAQTTII